jgi:segregation and condensation protein B
MTENENKPLEPESQQDAASVEEETVALEPEPQQDAASVEEETVALEPEPQQDAASVEEETVALEPEPQQNTASDAEVVVALEPETTDAQVAENTAAMEAENEKDVPIPTSNAPDNPLRVFEALLFASDEILTTDRIKAIVPGMPDGRKIRQMVEKINTQLGKERHPFEIVEIGGGYQFRTVSYYYPWVVQLFKEKASKKLSIQSLECLAIIGYKQPITKAEIESIRGVMSDGAMKTLLEKRLVTIAGRSEKAGRPLLYATTKDFLAYFGINKIGDLPRIEEFEAMAKEKLGDLTETELKNIETEKAQVMPEAESGAAAAGAVDTVAIEQNSMTPEQNQQQ